MKNALNKLAGLLLIIIGAGALYGGWSLMTDPTGGHIHLPLAMLKHSPFDDFLIPGIILFIANGIFSFTAIAALLLSVQKAPLFVFAEGCLLAGWLVTQVFLTKIFHPWQAIMGVAALTLVVCGWILFNPEKHVRSTGKKNITRKNLPKYHY